MAKLTRRIKALILATAAVTSTVEAGASGGPSDCLMAEHTAKSHQLRYALRDADYTWSPWGCDYPSIEELAAEEGIRPSEAARDAADDLGGLACVQTHWLMYAEPGFTTDPRWKQYFSSRGEEGQALSRVREAYPEYHSNQDVLDIMCKRLSGASRESAIARITSTDGFSGNLPNPDGHPAIDLIGKAKGWKNLQLLEPQGPTRIGTPVPTAIADPRVPPAERVGQEFTPAVGESDSSIGATEQDLESTQSEARPVGVLTWVLATSTPLVVLALVALITGFRRKSRV